MRTIMIGLAATGLLLSGCAGAIRDRIYQPSAVVAPPVWRDRAPQALTVRTADGVELTGLYWAPVLPERDIIVYFHGNGGSLYRDAVRAEPLAAGGHGVLMTSYRGFSGNGGAPTETGLRRDAAAFADYARTRLLSGGVLYLFGHSLGGAVALGEAARVPVAGVATLGAFTSLRDNAPGFARGILPDRFDTVALISNPGAPVLLFHGRRDTIIPFAQGEALAAASHGRATLVPLDTAGHHADMRLLAPMLWQMLRAPSG
jgi:uncharacterized protein